MAFSAQASQSVLRSQEFVRVFQPLESSGDIFEIDTSTKTLAIGPDSDVSDLEVTYYDPEQPSATNLATISASNPFIGRLDALLATKIPVANTKARILVSIKDLVDPSNDPALRFTPIGIDPADLVIRVRPQLDLFGYFSDPGNLDFSRADKEYDFRQYSINDRGVGIGQTWFMLPAYGRRLFAANIANYSGAPYDLRMFGVILPLIPGRASQTLLGLVPVGAVLGSTASIVARSSTVGLFDLIMVHVSGGATGAAPNQLPLRVTLCDSEVG